MAKIFATGMGVDVPESMQMCKSVPKLQLNSVQNAAHLQRDSSHRDGSLKLSYGPDDRFSDFKGIKMVDTSKMLNHNLNMKQKETMISEFTAIFQAKVNKTDTYPKDSLHNLISQENYPAKPDPNESTSSLKVF